MSTAVYLWTSKQTSLIGSKSGSVAAKIEMPKTPKRIEAFD
jgi:hypothetical protein